MAKVRKETTRFATPNSFESELEPTIVDNARARIPTHSVVSVLLLKLVSGSLLSSYLAKTLTTAGLSSGRTEAFRSPFPFVLVLALPDLTQLASIE